MIPIVQTHTAAGVTVTLISLEVYHGGFLVHGQHSAKYGEHGQENPWISLIVFTAHDDAGTEYRWWPAGGNRDRFSSQFAPALNLEARELRLTLTQIRWVFFTTHRHELDEGPWSFSIPLT